METTSLERVNELAKIICENVCGFATFALALVNNRYVLTSFPRFEIDRFLTTGCCLVIQRARALQAAQDDDYCQLIHFPA